MFPHFSHFFYHEQDQIKGSKLLKFFPVSKSWVYSIDNNEGL